MRLWFLSVLLNGSHHVLKATLHGKDWGWDAQSWVSASGRRQPSDVCPTDAWWPLLLSSDTSAEVCNCSFLLCQTFEVSMCPPLCSSAAMKLDDEVLTLNATAQLVHGVELSKDQTGVTAKMTTSNHTVTVLFDGYTTIIHATGQKYQVEGHPACGFHLVLLLVESDSTGQQDCIKIICI